MHEHINANVRIIRADADAEADTLMVLSRRLTKNAMVVK
jgi:hypothetical protein